MLLIQFVDPGGHQRALIECGIRESLVGLAFEMSPLSS